MNRTVWLQSTVIKGEHFGRTIGFPTLNLNPASVTDDVNRGVFAAKVKIRGNIYSGALYYGPRLVRNETHDVLEIHVLDFDGEIYGETVSFQMLDFIHPPKNFSSLEELRNQLKADCEAVKKLLQYHSMPK